MLHRLQAGHKRFAGKQKCATLKISGMVDYHYDDGVYRRTLKRRRLKYFLWSVAILVLAAAGWVIYDGLRAKEEINNNVEGQATLAQTAERTVFEEEKFRFTANAGWQEAPPIDDGHRNFRYQYMENGLVRREFRIYQDSIPQDYALTHVVEIEVVNNQPVSLGVSPKCSEIQPDKSNRRDIELSWGGVDFICDPDLADPHNIIGTSHNRDGYGTYLAGPQTEGRYFFIYRDFDAVPQLETFNNLIETFEVK